MKLFNLFKFSIVFIVIIFSKNNVVSEEPNTSWITDISKEAGLEVARGSRINLVDINGDNYPDLLWSEGAINKNRLHILLNVPNPNIESNVKRIFIEWTDNSKINVNRDPNKTGRIADIGAFVDVNNDGFPDLVSSIYYHRLQMYADELDPGDRSEVYLNDGDGHFTLLPDNGLYQLGLVNTTGLGFLDFDLDGNLDLFMGQWFRDYAYDTKQPSILLRGNGDGSFTKVSNPAISSNNEPLYGVNITDWNNDGWQDILTSPYCRSGGSLFTKTTNQDFVDWAVPANYSSQLMQGDNGQNLCQWEAQPADFDCDGDMDLLHVQVHGGYGENEGRTHISVNLGNDNNYLYRWELDRLKRDAPVNSHLGDQGGEWFDLDGDGLLDVTIGQMAYPDANKQGQERLYILKQNSEHYFDDISKKIGVYDSKEAHSIEPADYDLDGDQDLFFSRQHRDTTIKETIVEGVLKKDTSIAVYMQIHLLRNEIGNKNNWVSVFLEPPAKHNKSCVGVRIKVFADGLNQIREIQSGLGHFAGQVPFIQNISLGNKNRVDSIQVRWQLPGFPLTTIYNPAINMIHKINQNGLDGFIKNWENEVPVIATSKPLIDFGTINAGENSIQSIDIQNIGTETLQINSIAIDDDMQSALKILQVQLPASIPPNEKLTIQIEYTPKSRDTITISHIVINSNAFNSPIKLIDINGNGFKPEAIVGSSDTLITFTNAWIDSLYSKILTIRNLGEVKLKINELRFENNMDNTFSKDEFPDGIEINPKDSFQLQIYFRPYKKTEYTASLSIISNAYNMPTFQVGLYGNCNGPSPQISTQSASLIFGSVEIGKSVDKTLTIYNIGNGLLEIKNIVVETNTDNAFQIISEPLPLKLNWNDSAIVKISFTPKEEKNYKTKLLITSNSISDSNKSLSIFASGTKGSGVKENITQDNLLLIYPNPVYNNELFIEFPENKEEFKSIQIFDLIGNIQIEMEIDKVYPDIVRLDLSNLHNGTYFIIFSMGRNQIVKYFTIIK